MLALPLLVSSMTCLPTGICICTLCDTPVLLLLSYGARQHMFVSCTECWSQGRAKLRAFPHHLARENTQLNPSLTPTLGIRQILLCFLRLTHGRYLLNKKFTPEACGSWRRPQSCSPGCRARSRPDLRTRRCPCQISRRTCTATLS